MMQAKVCSLEELFKDQVLYVVPPYQRQYVWGRSQWEQLWSDIFEHYSNVRDAEKKGIDIDYYLGPIILMESQDSNTIYSQYHVVDGQQRLITLMILFSAIRYYAAQEKGDNFLAEQIDTTLSLKSGEEVIPRIIPSKKDIDNLHMILTKGKNLNPPDDNIYRAFLFYKHRIDTHDTIRSGISVFFDVIMRKINLVVIHLTRAENPYLVFESVNSKGEDLTESDLVKNLFFSKYTSSVEADEMYATYWEPMEERFDRNLDELSGYLRHYYMMHGDIIEKRKIFSTIKGLFEELSADEVKELTKKLYRYSLYYQMILNPEKYIESIPPAIIKHLIRIRNLNTETPYPFLLHCFSQNDDQNDSVKILSDDGFEKILIHIESYLIRRFVCQKKTNYLPTVFSELCPRYGTEHIPLNAYDIVQKINTIQKAEPPADGEFFEYLTDKDLYRKGTALSAIKVVLSGIEDALRIGFKRKYPNIDQQSWPDLNLLFQKFPSIS